MNGLSFEPLSRSTRGPRTNGWSLPRNEPGARYVPACSGRVGSGAGNPGEADDAF